MQAILVLADWALANWDEPETVEELDLVVCAWMEDAYERDRRAEIGINALSGIKLLSPKIYSQLPDARALLVDWEAADKTQANLADPP